MIRLMHVFLPSGKALTFHDVNIQVDDINLFIFTYVSVGTGESMRAKFLQAAIVGYSVPVVGSAKK